MKDLFTSAGQTSLKRRYSRTEHGGSNVKGRRKSERPLSTKKWIHVVLKAPQAKGQYSFLSPRNRIKSEQILKEQAKRHHVNIGDFVNAGNHFHIKVRIQSRQTFQNFLRIAMALIARAITGARRGRPFGRFWEALAYTRVLKSAFEELNLRGYFEANRIGVRQSREAREDFAAKFREWVRSTERSFARSPI